jgi:hypothetical protein
VPPVFTDAFVDDMIEQMRTLGARPYAEIGVPMFLIAEDLTAGTSAPPAGPGKADDLAALFARIAEALASRKPELDMRDICRLVELFADRYFLEFTTPPFSAIGALHPEPA